MKQANGNEAFRIATAEEFSVQAYFETFSRLVPRLPYEEIQQIIAVILQAFAESRTIFIFGNGGSAATASHLMCDLNKAPISIIPYGDSRRFKVMAFTDNVPLLTAWANDLGYEHVFSEPLKNFVRHGDIVLAISSSGNSPNIIEALKTAREAGAVTLGLSGCDGGSMQPLCDVCAVVPSGNIQMVEDLHQAIAHSIVTEVRGRLVAGARRRRAHLRSNGYRR